MIDKLLLYAVNTGCFTSICAISLLIAAVTSARTFIDAIFYFAIARLYTNSLLATLNGRDKVRAAGLYNSSGEPFVHDAGTGSRIPGSISINIDTQKEFVTDIDRPTSANDGKLNLR